MFLICLTLESGISCGLVWDDLRLLVVCDKVGFPGFELLLLRGF